MEHGCVLWLLEAVEEEVKWLPCCKSHAEHLLHNSTSVTLHPQWFCWARSPVTLKFLNEMCNWGAWSGTERRWAELSSERKGERAWQPAVRVNPGGSQNREMPWNVKEGGIRAQEDGQDFNRMTPNCAFWKEIYFSCSIMIWKWICWVRLMLGKRK